MRSNHNTHNGQRRNTPGSVLFALALLATSSSANAQGYLEAFVVSYDGFIGKNLYGEMNITEATALQFNHYDDDDYESNYVGLARTFGGVQLGLGLGQSEYANDEFTALNPWLWYQENGWEAYAEMEYMPDDTDSNYLRGYVHRDFGYFFAGVYAETDVGTGPSVGMRFAYDAAGVSFNAIKPIVDKPALDPSDWVGYVTFWVNF